MNIKKILPITIVAICIFLLGGGILLIHAFQTGKATKGEMYYIITTPNYLMFLSLLTLSTYITFIDSPKRISKNPRLGKLEFVFGLILLLTFYFSIEALYTGGFR